MVLLLLQTTCDVTAFTVGIGFTVMTKVIGVPEQLFALGMTVIVPAIGLVPALVATNEGILPVLPKPKPMAVFELAQV